MLLWIVTSLFGLICAAFLYYFVSKLYVPGEIGFESILIVLNLLLFLFFGFSFLLSLYFTVMKAFFKELPKNFQDELLTLPFHEFFLKSRD